MAGPCNFEDMRHVLLLISVFLLFLSYQRQAKPAAPKPVGVTAVRVDPQNRLDVGSGFFQIFIFYEWYNFGFYLFLNVDL